MEQEIKYVQIGLENTEVIDVEVTDIQFMLIEGIKGFDTIPTAPVKTVKRRKTCSSFFIILKKKIDKKYRTYGGLSKYTVFERLIKYSDIVDITYLNESKGVVDSLNVPWKEWRDAGETNNYQHNKVNEYGDLEILIKGEYEW